MTGKGMLAGGATLAALIALLAWFLTHKGEPLQTTSSDAASPARENGVDAVGPGTALGAGGLLPPVQGLGPTEDATVAAAVEAAPGAVAPAVVDPTPQVVIKVAREQVLARVDGQPLRIGDLVVLSPDAAELAIEEDELDARLADAINDTLVSRAAAASKVELSAEQSGRLAQIAKDHEAATEKARAEGLGYNSYGPAQIELEVRRTRALMLQEELVAKSGGPAASDPGYAEAVRTLLAGLRSGAAIELSPK